MVAAEVNAADEKFEIVSSGAAITLLAEGNAGIYSREGIVCIPVSGLEPARLAIAWRRGDRRPAVRDFVRACRDVAGAQSGTSGPAARVYRRHSPPAGGSSRSSATRNLDPPGDPNSQPSYEAGPHRNG